MDWQNVKKKKRLAAGELIGLERENSTGRRDEIELYDNNRSARFRQRAGHPQPHN